VTHFVIKLFFSRFQFDYSLVSIFSCMCCRLTTPNVIDRMFGSAIVHFVCATFITKKVTK